MSQTGTAITLTPGTAASIPTAPGGASAQVLVGILLENISAYTLTVSYGTQTATVPPYTVWPFPQTTGIMNATATAIGTIPPGSPASVIPIYFSQGEPFPHQPVTLSTPVVNVANASIVVSGSVNATITNASIPVTGTVNANVTNASIAVTGSVNANVTNATLTIAGAVTVTSGSVTVSSGTVNIGTTPGPSNVQATGTLGALNAAVQVALQGTAGCGIQIPAASTLVGTLTPELSYDGGTTWSVTQFYVPASTATAATQVTVSGTAYALTLVTAAGATHGRVRVSAYTSGSASATVTATTNPQPVVYVSAGSVNANITNASITVAGSVNANVTNASITVAGSVTVSSGTINIGATPGPSNVQATGTLGALNNAVQVALQGTAGCGIQIPAAGTLVGTLTPELSYDGGTTWSATQFYVPASNATAATQVTASGTAYALTLVTAAGATHGRVRVSAYTSGSASATVTATTNPQPSVYVSAGSLNANITNASITVAGTVTANVSNATIQSGTVNVNLNSAANVGAPSTGPAVAIRQVGAQSFALGYLSSAGSSTIITPGASQWIELHNLVMSVSNDTGTGAADATITATIGGVTGVIAEVLAPALVANVEKSIDFKGMPLDKGTILKMSLGTPGVRVSVSVAFNMLS